MVAYPKADFRRLLVFIFILLLLPLCACTAVNPDAAADAATMEEAVDEAGSAESFLGSSEAISHGSSETAQSATEYGIAEGEDVASSAALIVARGASEFPKLWIEHSLDKEVQVKYDIVQLTKTTGAIDEYNRSISRVLYEYLQKNEPGKEKRLVENFNEWYSKMIEKLQTIKEDERKEFLNDSSVEYIKPITAEIEGKFSNACGYAQYIYTNARFMFHFYNTINYRSESQGISYYFTIRGTRCMQLYALPVGEKDTLQNSTILTLDYSEYLYYKGCVESFTFTYKNKIYYLLINGFDKVEHPKARGVLYRLEDDRLNLKSICPIM